MVARNVIGSGSSAKSLSQKERIGRSQGTARPPVIRVGSVSHYQVMPHSREIERSRPRWRIELHGLGPNAGPIGLDICGDTVLGRGTEGAAGPDLDLGPFGAMELGVSRRHAMLRPTAKHLLLIDLVSNNGIRCNSAPLGVGRSYPVKHNDTISLGGLAFQVKIIGGPGGPLRG